MLHVIQCVGQDTEFTLFKNTRTWRTLGREFGLLLWHPYKHRNKKHIPYHMWKTLPPICLIS